jgi:WhiB family redox-sensing transcriptional regulator
MFDATHANCAKSDPEIFFPEGARTDILNSTRYAKAICASCPIQKACLQEAIDNNYDTGVWGGTTPTERRAIVLNAKHPIITNYGRRRK